MTADLLESEGKNIAVNITGQQVISTLDLFKLIFEVLQLEENIHLSEQSKVVSHYKISPYSFQPKESKKLVPKKFIDIGQGVLEIIHEIKKELTKFKLKNIFILIQRISFIDRLTILPFETS